MLRVNLYFLILVLFSFAPLLFGCLYAFDEGDPDAAQDDDTIYDDDAIDDDYWDDDLTDDDNDDDVIDDDTLDDDVSYEFFAAGIDTIKDNGFIWRRTTDSTEWIPDEVFPLVTEWTLANISCHQSGVCWAVGGGDTGAWVGLLLQYDGSNWFASPSPLLGGGWSLTDVTLNAADHGWAAGAFDSHLSVILEWTGNCWQSVEVAWPYTPNGLNAIDASPDGAVAAVGYQDLNSSQRGFAVQWDGAQWEIVNLPVIASAYSLRDVAVLEAGSAFAVGQTALVSHGVMFQWRGSVWREADLPLGEESYALTSISDFDADHCVAAGYYLGSGLQILLIYENSNWTLAEVPMAGIPNSVFMISPQEVLVGGQDFIHYILMGSSIQAQVLPAANALVKGFSAIACPN